MSGQRVLTVRDISRTLDVTNQCIWKFIKSGRLKATRTEDREYKPAYQILSSDFDEFLRQRVKDARKKASDWEACIGRGGK